MYALDKNKELTAQGLSKAIRCEIKDELKIELPEDIDYSKSIFAFYRDLVEGGKPQFLFYFKTNLYSSKEFEEHFKKVMKNRNVKKTILAIDSLSLPNGEKLNIMPSAVASVVLLLQAI